MIHIYGYDFLYLNSQTLNKGESFIYMEPAFSS